MRFPESAHAHKWLDDAGPGIEIGGSYHNPFGIKGCINIDYTESLDTIYKQEEIRLAGQCLPVDRVDEGDKLSTFDDNSLGFILSSHVFEHFPNPLGALIRWREVLRDGGIIYMVVPKRDTLESDAAKPITTIEHLIEDLHNGETHETHPCGPQDDPRGHYHVFDLDIFEQIVRYLNNMVGVVVGGDQENFLLCPFEWLDWLNTDPKVGNGYVLVLKVNK